MTERCNALNGRKRQCRHNALEGSPFCSTHQGYDGVLASDYVPDSKKKKKAPKPKKPKKPKKKPGVKKGTKRGPYKKKPPKTKADMSSTYPSKKQLEEKPDVGRKLELARELVENLELGVPLPPPKITELFELLLGRPLTLDETRAVISYGINTAMKLVQNSSGTISEWVPDWQARKGLSTELRHLSKWDKMRPPDPEPQNYYIVRMPCPAQDCPIREKK